MRWAPPRGMGVFFLLLSLALLSRPAGAQGLSAGIVVGRSWSSMVFGPRGSSNGDRVGFSFGPNLRTRLARALSVNADLLVTPKGFERTQPTIQANYLELAVIPMLEFTTATARVQPYFGLGAAAALMLQCRRFFVGIDGYHRDGCHAATASNLQLGDLRRVDVLADARFGLRVAGDRGAFALESRLARGLIDIDPVDAGESNNLTLALSLRYERRIGIP